MTRVVGGRMRAYRGLCGRLVIFLFASCPASFPVLKYFPDHRHHIPYIANGGTLSHSSVTGTAMCYRSKECPTQMQYEFLYVMAST